MPTRFYGWKMPLPQPKPFKFCPSKNATLVPASVDLQPHCPPVYDQGQLGSCTANAGAGLYQFLILKNKLFNFVPSRLALYYWERAYDGDVSQDAGSSLSTCVHCLVNNGVANESLWWYDINKFAAKPSKNVVMDAAKHKASQGLAVNQDLADMKACVAAGYPFIIGFTVYESFEAGNWDSTTGMMPMPTASQGILGGHAVMAMGYDDSRKAFKIRNSWGTSWGLGGYFWMPYAFIADGNYASDFWTVHNLIFS